MRVVIRPGLLVIAAAMTLAACASKDPIQATLDQLAKAAHERDADAVMSLVAPDFQAADGSGRAEAEVLLRRYFAAYEILTVTLRDVAIERGENAARVRLRAELSGQPRKVGGLDGLLPSSSAYDFDLRLVPDGKKWKIAWASWNPAGGS